MEQSAAVKEVLSSKEFRTWLPDSREYIELTRAGNIILGLTVSGGLALICMLVFARDLARSMMWTVLLFGLIGVFMLIFAAVIGFGQPRIVRLDQESIEIGTSKAVMLDCAWNDILSVRKVGANVFEIVTTKGTALVSRELVTTSAGGYQTFFFHVLYAMSGGLVGSQLSNYKPPIELEEGKRYAYRMKASLFPYGLLLLAVLLIPLTIFDIVHGKDILSSVLRLVVFLMVGLTTLSTEVSRRKNSRSIVWIEGHLIHVESPEGKSQFPFKRQSPKLTPNTNPMPFHEAESYGTTENSVTVDRRFLYPI